MHPPKTRISERRTRAENTSKPTNIVYLCRIHAEIAKFAFRSEQAILSLVRTKHHGQNIWQGSRKIKRKVELNSKEQHKVSSHIFSKGHLHSTPYRRKTCYQTQTQYSSDYNVSRTCK